tara:strand:- start:1201 stop:2094 length:894 start_codon:yes stop_codon:yes gene_type:complete
MDNLICINSHCNTDEKISILKENISYLKNKNKNILLISHIPLDKHIVESVDHFIYDKVNPILKYPEKYNVVWSIIDNYRLISYNPDIGWCFLNQWKIIANYCKNLQYKTYTFINYDTILDDNMIQFSEKNLTNIFSNDINNNPSVLFNQIIKKDLNKIIEFDKIEYVSTLNKDISGPAEQYFNKVVRDNVQHYKLYPNYVGGKIDDEVNKSIVSYLNFNNENNYFRLFNDDNFIILYELVNPIKFNIDGQDKLVHSTTILDLPKQISYYDYDDNLVNITHMLKLKNELYKYEIRKLN